MTSANGYAGLSNLEVMEAAIRYNQFLLELILSVAAPRDSVLDFGAGSGTFAERLHCNGIHAVCVEPDAHLRSILEKKGLRTISRVKDVPSESVDVVYSLNVLEHIDDDAAALGELRRVLRPGGRFLLYVPAFMILFSAMDRRVGHVRRYRKKALAHLAMQAGFRIEDVRYVDSLGFFAALAFKAFGQRSGELTVRAVRWYDKWLFPVSRIFDFGLSAIVGKNLVLHASRPPA